MNFSKIIKIISICILVIFILTSIVLSQSTEQISATIVQFKVFLNGEEKVFENSVVAINDRTYIPLREVAETLGINVEWNDDEKRIDLENELVKGNETMINMMIFPSSARALSYKIDLSTDGQLATTVGHAGSEELFDAEILIVRAKDFTPMITRHKTLTAFEMEELISFMSKIKINEKRQGGICEDGWYVTIAYQGEEYQYIYGLWYGSEYMLNLMQKLIEHSPIEIVTYAYDDPYQSEYYENFDW